MKKPYEKPQLIALSLKANDALCACAVDPKNNPKVYDWINMPGAFGSTAENCTIIVDEYCKMANASILFNS